MNSNATARAEYMRNVWYGADAPDGLQSMHLIEQCYAHAGGVYQDVEGFIPGKPYELFWHATGGTWSAGPDHTIATVMDGPGGSSAIWAQHFYAPTSEGLGPEPNEEITGGWQTLQLEFTAQATTGRVRFETAAVGSCSNVDNVAIHPLGDCDNACQPGGSYTGPGDPAGCTTDYCDQYALGGELRHRCDESDAGHHYAVAECQKTCGICEGTAN